MIRRTLVALALAATVLAVAAVPAHAATAAPSAPRFPVVHAGVDGVRVYWSAPSTTNGGLTGYRVHRAAPGEPAAPLGEVTAAAARTYYDTSVAAGETWTYTVTAYNDAGESVPTAGKAATIPAPVEPGTVDALAVDGAAGSWGDGATWAFGPGGSTVQIAYTMRDVFGIRGASASGTPQGERETTWRIGSVVDGARLTPGTYPAVDSFQPGAGQVQLGPNLNPCSGAPGSLTVTEASFLSDGTPLTFAATFTYTCGVTTYGVVRWRAHGSYEAITTSSPSVDFGSVAVGGAKDLPLVLHNAGSSAQQLGAAALAGDHAGDYAVVADTCSATELAPGSTCTLTLRAAPTASGTRAARLTITDQTARGGRDVRLATWGVTPPGATRFFAQAAFRAVSLGWDYPPTTSPPTAYRIYRGTSPDDLALVAELPGSQATVQHHLDTGVVAGTRYYYALTASNLAGEGARAFAEATPLATGIVFADNTTGGPRYTVAAAGDNGLKTSVAAYDADHDMPALSPDGSTVVYMSDRGNAGGDYDLWTKPLYGAAGSATRITSGAADDVAPAWSPDGTRIAFTRFTAAGPAVYVVPAAGGTAVAVPGTAGDAFPSWSPNGRLLAVGNITAATPYLAVTSLDGSYRRAVAGSGMAVDPSWSPDGGTLAFVRITSTGRGQLATLPVAGGTPTVLTDAGMDVLSADWRPDGSEIVFEGEQAYSSIYFWAVPPSGGTPRGVAAGSGYDHTSVSPAGPRAGYVAGAVSPVNTLRATLGAGRATLSWSAPAGTAYVVVRRSEPGGAAPATPESGVAVYAGSASTATATGLANGAAYAFSVFAVSFRGDESPAATVVARPAAVPRVTPNGSVLEALAAGGPGFTARWGAALPAGQVYDVQLGVRVRSAAGTWSAPAWQAWRTTPAGSGVVSAVAGRTYHLRARVRDAAGNVTPWSATAVAPVPFDDRALTAAGTWSALTAPGRYRGTLRAASAAGAKLSFTVEAAGLSLVADRCATCGKVRVYVDGVLKATVDTFASSTQPRRVVWSTSFSKIGKHTVAVVVAGTPGRPAVRVDGLVARR